MKLLYVTYKNKWLVDLFRNFHYIVLELVNKHNFVLVDLSNYTRTTTTDMLTNENININNVECILYIENHNQVMIQDIVTDFFTFGGAINENMSKTNTVSETKGITLEVTCPQDITRYILCDDFHKYYDMKKSNYYEYFDMIFVSYRGPFMKLYPHVDENRVVWVPHGYNPEFNVKFNTAPKNKILLSGAIGSLYPVRKLIKKYFEHNKGKIDYKKHPHYNNIDKQYPSLLNKYVGCVTDCLVLNYTISKYFEIPATGSLLLAKIPESGPYSDDISKLGFIDGVNFMSIDETNYIERIDYVLDPKNRAIIDDIRFNGYNMIRANHSLSIRVTQIIQTINSYAIQVPFNFGAKQASFCFLHF